MSEAPPAQKGITKIIVSGYKSISQEQSIEIRPLTILAGANSSGKSSMIQPLLLLKQTLEASYDPGPLLLDGPNVRFTSAEQLLSHTKEAKHVDNFHVGLQANSNTLTIYFQRQPGKGFEIQKEITELRDGKRFDLHLEMSHSNIKSLFRSTLPDLSDTLSTMEQIKLEISVYRNRCFLDFGLTSRGEKGEGSLKPIPGTISDFFSPYLRELIHLPGLRGNPARTYPGTAVGSTFPGTFENYAASVIAQWQLDNNNGRLEKLGQDLKELGLTWKVSATPINDTQVELQVGRLTHAAKGGARDLVSIADVGFGVSQTLPVLVALRIAEPGQLLYLEQPEIHLHPRAQTAMAQVLADAANRGVRVIVETHSSLLILGVQTLVAEGKLSPETVKLHWFERRNGTTQIKSADLDESGAFGDWPEDFADIALEAQSKYLDAAESHMKVS